MFEYSIEDLKRDLLAVYEPLVLVTDYDIFADDYQFLGLFYSPSQRKYGIINYITKEPLYGIDPIRETERRLIFFENIEDIQTIELSKLFRKTVKRLFLEKVMEIEYASKNRS